MSVPRVWVLLGHRTGDDNQLLRLAGELGVPFDAIELSYNALHLLPPRLLGASFANLTPRSRERLQPPWPDLLLGIGHRSVPTALAIRKASRGACKLVRLGNPRLSPRWFDLVITTPQYGVPPAPNVLRLPLGLSTATPTDPSREERDWLSKLPPPHRLFLIGGDTFMWTLAPQTVAEAARAIAAKPGGSTIAVSSGRTPTPVAQAVGEALRGSEHALVWGRVPRYPVLLADADEIYVTADSVAMISDSVATGKPVGLVEPQLTASGRVFYGAQRLGAPVPVRDIRRVWSWAQREGLAGTVDQPLAGKLDPEPLDRAVAAVRRLLES